MNVKQLIEYLSDFPEDATVRLATQPNYPLQHSLDLVECVGAGSDEYTDKAVVFLGGGLQTGYLTIEAQNVLGWL